MKSKFLGLEADLNYSAALEVSESGELSLRDLENITYEIEMPTPLSRESPKDVTVQFEKLLKVTR